MREQFEVLTKIAQALNEHQSIFFDEEMNRYKTLSSIASDAMVTLYIDGAWYAFQEQQKKIDLIKSHIGTHLDANYDKDDFDRGWLSAFKCIDHNINLITGEEK